MKNNTVKSVQKKWLLILGVALSPVYLPILAPNASAATIPGNTADALVASGSVSEVSAETIAAGSEAFGNPQRAYVSVFQLPNFGPVSNPFSSASASYTLISASGSPWVRVNLRGINGARVEPTVLLGDAGGGTDVGLNLTTSSGAGVKTTTGSGLLDFLNAQYDTGNGAGKFVFLTFQPDDFGDTSYNFATADNATEADRPVITYEASSSGPTYTSWANDALKGNIPGEPATGDFDNDGLSNLVEYALGKNPRVSDLPPGTLVGQVLTFTKGPDAMLDAAISYIIEQSTALTGWTDVVTDNNPANTTVTYTLSATPKDFARLKIVQN